MPTTSVFDSITTLVGTTLNFNKPTCSTEQHAEKIFAASIYHALAEFAVGTGESFNSEEHRTSAFMGYLGACISWYNLLSGLSMDESEQLSVLWNSQNKKTSNGVPGENTTGGDFGVAVQLPSGNYNLIFFQAKQDKPLSDRPRLDFNQVPGCYSPKNENSCKQEVDKEFLDWCKNGTILPLSKEKVNRHQIMKLMSTNESPFAQNADSSPISTERKNWTHYVVWRTAVTTDDSIYDFHSSEPLCLSLDEVKTHIEINFQLNRHAFNYPDHIFMDSGIRSILNYIPIVLKNTFANLLISGMSPSADGWLEVSLKDAISIVGNLTRLGMDWAFVEPSKKGGPKLTSVLKETIGRPVLPKVDKNALAGLSATMETVLHNPRSHGSKL